MTVNSRRRLFVAFLALGSFNACAPGQTDVATSTDAAVFVEGLGSLSFPNSGAAGAQDAFRRGVLLLHSFEYEPAAAAFREAQ